MGIIELPDDVVVNIDGDVPGEGSEDWMKGLRGWPYPDIQSAAHMRKGLKEWGQAPSAFRKTVLFKRWVDRLPWLSEV